MITDLKQNAAFTASKVCLLKNNEDFFKFFLLTIEKIPSLKEKETAVPDGAVLPITTRGKW